MVQAGDEARVPSYSRGRNVLRVPRRGQELSESRGQRPPFGILHLYVRFEEGAFDARLPMQDMLGQRPASQGHDHRQASGDFGGQQTRAHQAADKEVCG